MLRITLFGTLEVTEDDTHTLIFRRNKTGLLLACLALKPERSHSREMLADMLWDEGESDTLRNRLRQLLSQLRGELRAQNIHDEALLEADQNTLRLRPEVVTDLLQYRSLLKGVERTEDPAEKTRLLLKAVALYRAPLLADFDTPEIVTERENLAHRHADAMTQLAVLLQGEGNLTGAVETMQALLVHDPYREEVHADLMRLYAAMGQPTQVLKQYQLLETALKDAFDEQPSQATRSLVEQLREQAAQNASGNLSPIAPPPPVLSNDVPESTVHDKSSDEVTQEFAVPPTRPSLATEAPQKTKPVREFRRPLALCAGLLCLAGGVFAWNRMHRLDPSKPVWAVEYHAQVGEKENSEATDVVTDEEGNVYVCGFTQTEAEDVDMLVLKYSPDGVLLWNNRYTSPEHDCDRAFALIVDRGSVFITGETYVPDTPKSKGGWYLVTVKYDAENGAEQWAQRSEEPLEHRDNSTRIVSDGRGGVYTAGTEIKPDGTTAMYLVHHNWQGKRLWTYRAPSASRLQDMIGLEADGVVLGGAWLRSASATGGKPKSEVALVRIDFTGTEIWQLPLSVTADSSDDEGAVCLVKDAQGAVFAAGRVELSQSPLRQALWFAKLSTAGNTEWIRTFTQEGGMIYPHQIAVSDKAIYLTGHTTLSGGADCMIALAYDKQGNPQWTYGVSAKDDARWTVGMDMALAGNVPIFAGTIYEPIEAGRTSKRADALFQTIPPDGKSFRQILYDNPSSTNNTADHIVVHRERRTGKDSLYSVGQTNAEAEGAHIEILKLIP